MYSCLSMIVTEKNNRTSVGALSFINDLYQTLASSVSELADLGVRIQDKR